MLLGLTAYLALGASWFASALGEPEVRWALLALIAVPGLIAGRMHALAAIVGLCCLVLLTFSMWEEGLESWVIYACGAGLGRLWAARAEA